MNQANLWSALQQSALVGADRLAVPAVLTAADVSTPATVQAVQLALQQPAASTAAQVLRASAVAAVFDMNCVNPQDRANKTTVTINGLGLPPRIPTTWSAISLPAPL